MTVTKENPRHGSNVTGANNSATNSKYARNSVSALTTGELGNSRLNIATSSRHDSKEWNQQEITWDELVSWLNFPANEKEGAGSYVLGRLKGTTRTKETILDRCALTLDADHPRAGFLDRLRDGLDGHAAVVHTTYSSTAEAPRYRVIVPLAQPVTPEDYRAAVTELMARVGQGSEFDPGSAQPERLMFMPSVQRGQTFWHDVLDGPRLDAAPLVEAAHAADLTETTPAPDSPAGPEDAEAYFRRAVDNESDLLSFHEEGGRNNALNRAAFKLGQIAHLWTSEDAEDVARQALTWACEENGLPVEEFDGAFNSGWRSGLSNPRDIEPAEQTSDHAEADGIPAGGWEPVDLTQFLDGTHEPLVPTVMTRTDGLALLYAGMTHSIHGESESGKSMLVQATAAALLAEGQRVLYLDYEADPGSVAERLTLMGAPAHLIRANLDYLQPEVDYDNSDDSRAAFGRLMEGTYALAVVDGVTEALTQAPAKLRSTGGLGGNDDVTEWHNRLPRRIARRTGAAVVQIDHVAKTAESTRFAIGGQAKMASITGAAYYVKPVEALAKGRVGAVEVYVAKDRHGHVRSRAEGEFNAKTRMQLVASAVVDGTGGRIEVELVPPASASQAGADTDLMGRVSGFLGSLPEDHKGATRTFIRQSVTGKNESIDAALDALVRDGYVSRSVVGQGTYHLSLRPFVDLL